MSPEELEAYRRHLIKESISVFRFAFIFMCSAALIGTGLLMLVFPTPGGGY